MFLLLDNIIFQNFQDAVNIAVLAHMPSILFLSCATRYTKVDLTGGYSDSKLDKDIFVVSFLGNAAVSLETTKIYVMYRCAEITKMNGFNFFMMLTNKTGYESVSKNQLGGLVFPTSRATIQAFIEKPDTKDKFYDVYEVMETLNTNIQR